MRKGGSAGLSFWWFWLLVFRPVDPTPQEVLHILNPLRTLALGVALSQPQEIPLQISTQATTHPTECRPCVCKQLRNRQCQDWDKHLLAKWSRGSGRRRWQKVCKWYCRSVCYGGEVCYSGCAPGLPPIPHPPHCTKGQAYSQPEVSVVECCATLLSTKEDFERTRSRLQEMIENAGHIFVLYPKS